MKRLHIHVSVDDIGRAVPFYATLFGADPAVRKLDYAKWMLDEPRVNFAVSSRGRAAGLDHLGIQVDSEPELGAIAARLGASGAEPVEERQATCCYARSDKVWVTDPAGIAWETFLTHGQAPSYGEERPDVSAAAASCCGAAPCGPSAVEKPAAATGGACCSAA